MIEILLASFAAIIVENVIFTTALGTSTLIELSKKRSNIWSYGLFITEFAVFSSVLTYFIEGPMLLSKTASRFLPCLYILSLGLVYVFTLLAIWFGSKNLFKMLKKYVHLSAFNCAVLSVLFNNTLTGGNLGERVIYAAQVGIGFAFAAYILSVNYEKLNSEDVPQSFKGLPIYILYIGIVSMIVYAIAR